MYQIGTVHTLIHEVCVIHINIPRGVCSVIEADLIDHQGCGAREGWTVEKLGSK